VGASPSSSKVGFSYIILVVEEKYQALSQVRDYLVPLPQRLAWLYHAEEVNRGVRI
jgi:hypothetical protein